MMALTCGGTFAAAPAKNKPPVVTLTSPTPGATYSQPASITLSATAADPEGNAITKMEFLRGSTVIATLTAAPYTYTWTGAAVGSYSITARATDSKGAAGTSAAASITVTAPQPVTSITSPANNATITFGNAVDVTGTFVGTAETTILVHSTQQGSTVVARQTSATTYLAQAVPLSTGVNTLVAKAVRRDGTSSSGSVTVNVPSMMAVVTAPTKGGTYDAGAPLTLRASVGTATGTIQRVDWFRTFVGPLGSSTTPPYAVTINPAAGDYNVFARVVDALGNTRDSQAIDFTVLGPNQLPAVSLTSPAPGQTYTAPASFTLSANASDADGSVTFVEFLQNGQALGSYSSAPYSHAVSGLVAGTYVFTARATDNRSGVTTSSPVSVSVNPPGNSPPTVTLTSPTEAVPGARLTLSATASDSDGSINRVEFHAGGNLIGTATTSPYTLSWQPAATGTFVVTATAYDNGGAATLSSPTTLKVWDGITYLHHDIAGNVIAASDSAGNQIWKESFRPYGEKLKNESASQGNRQAFHGKEADEETGLSYFGARYYDPVIGRFMGVDSVQFDQKNIHSFNRYAYGNNSPYKFTDPDGHSPVSVLMVEAAKMTGLRYVLGVGADAVSQYAAFGSVDFTMAATSSAAIAGGATGLGGVVIGGALKGLGVLKNARELAKAEVFAARTAPELKQIYGWGNGEAGVKAAREALDATVMARIQASVTKAEVEATRTLYKEAAAAGRGGAVAPERAKYMEDILKLWQ